MTEASNKLKDIDGLINYLIGSPWEETARRIRVTLNAQDKECEALRQDAEAWRKHVRLGYDILPRDIEDR